MRKAWRALTWLLVILVAGGALIAAGVSFWGWTAAPKLGLDLQGGTQVILAPQLANKQTITSDELNQAVSIIRKRVDASGIGESQIQVQGSSNVIVSIPGKLDAATEQRIESSSKLEIRPVIVSGAPTATASSSPSASDSASGSASPSPSTSKLSDTPSVKPSNASDPNYVTPALQAKYDAYQCSAKAAAAANVAPENKPIITCDDAGSTKYILGPVEVKGSDITNAVAATATNSSGVNSGEWVVNITYNGEGGAADQTMTNRLITLPAPRNEFGFMLDGTVLSAPEVQGVTGTTSQISGSFTEASATTLADQLKFGSLPVSFTVQSKQQVSATLGSSQLLSGLFAGLIGLGLVVVYSLLQYRLLGFVTVFSLTIAAALTYEVITVLSGHYGYRLSLAGIAGLIISIGFTADSFIVYFERIRDELRDGRGLVGAVEAGWGRALRTIFAAKGVNLLSAIVLYVLAVGNVQGFAFTLGLTTIIDVFVVIVFTHPILQLLASTRFFASGHPATGLDPNALGAIYRGRAQFRVTTDARRAGASAEAQRRQTIAERKAAQLAAANAKDAPKKPETPKKTGSGKRDS